MTEKETQKKTSQEESDETKNTEKSQEELTIPKSRFDEVNNTKKELEEKLAEIERQKEEESKKKLEEDGKLKELLDLTKAENDKLKLEGTKRDLIQEAIINKELHPKLSKMVTGSTEEELKKSLEDAKSYFKEMEETIKGEHTATDDSGTGKTQKKKPMSTEAWMKLYQENPEEANRILLEETENAN